MGSEGHDERVLVKYPLKGNQVSSEGLLVRCQLESQDLGMSRDGALWKNTFWAGRPADRGDVTLCDLSGANSISCGRRKRC